MLVLSRKPGERILLESDDGERMEICLVRIEPNNARIGIESPRRWNIVREEIAGRAESRASSVESQREHPDDVVYRGAALAIAEAACDVRIDVYDLPKDMQRRLPTDEQEW